MLKQTKLSNKCQITIPKAVRDLLKIDKGDEVLFYIEDNEIKLTSIKNIKVKATNSKKISVIRKGEK